MGPLNFQIGDASLSPAAEMLTTGFNCVTRIFQMQYMQHVWVSQSV